MTEPTVPFIGSMRVPWLRPLAQGLRVLALVVGGSTAVDAGTRPVDVVMGVGLLGFLAWRAAAAGRWDERLRDVMLVEVTLTTLGVAITGGWSSPWLLAQLVSLGLVALGLQPVRLAIVSLSAVLVTTIGSLWAWPDPGDLGERVGATALIVVFGGISRSVLVGSSAPTDDSLGRLDVLWSVRGLLEGLHTRATGSGAMFDVAEALTTLRASHPTLAEAEVLALFAVEPDGTLRRLHSTGLPERTFRIRDLPSRVGEPRRDGIPVAQSLSGGGLGRDSALGLYLWLPVAADEPPHVLAVEYGAGTDLAPDALLPDVTRVAQPLAVTVSNAAWFARVRHLGVDEERQRIAARLHDQFAQSLAVVSMQLELAARRHPEDSELRELRQQVGETLGGLRDTMVELRASVTEDHDLAHVLSSVVARLRERHGVVAELVVEGEGPRPSLAVEQQLLRTVQELTRRAVEERGAFAVYLRIEHRPDALVVAVQDDGEAPHDEPERAVADVVRGRAEAIGARVVIAHGGDGLSTVSVELDRPRTGERP